MTSRWSTLIIVFSTVIALTTATFADFEPLFQVIDITGDCSLQRPTEDSFSPAEDLKAYPYGTKIITGEQSSLTISFSQGNLCRILADANVNIDEDKKDSKLKIIRLNSGEVEIELKEDFHKNGYGLNVETATATCSAIGCKFRVASKAEEDLQVIIIRVIEGMIRVFGENFDAATLDENDWISLLSPSDRSFLRLKTMKGEFDVTIKAEDMQDKAIPTEEGTVLKIWQRFVPETGQRVVTVVLTAPDGTLIETFTVTYGEGQNPPFEGGQEKGTGDKPADEPQPRDDGEKGPPVVYEKDPQIDLDIDPDPAKDPGDIGGDGGGGGGDGEPDVPNDPTPTGKR